MTFRVVSLSSILCVALCVPALGAPSSPSPHIMATVNGVMAAINANDATRVNAYFTARSTVVDEIPPYIWSGRGAGGSWWHTVQSSLARERGSALRVTVQRITAWNSSPSGAYVVLPLTISHTVRGRMQRESGLWALTMKRIGSSWLITTASWATLNSP